MTESRTVSSAVDVPVAPDVAFSVFTDELDLWWVRGPINFFDAARAVAMRCEAGVGGRLLEMYDEAADDALELARITVWEPGRRLAWLSSIDDVAVEVTFDRCAAGTTVRVEATIRPGGKDRGGTAWVRMVPPCLDAWFKRRDSAARVPSERGRLALAVHYERPAAAARWLAAAFGLTSVMPLPDAEDSHSWIEFHVGDSSLIVLPADGPTSVGGAPTHVPWIHVDDLDAHLRQAKAHGAVIVEDVHQHGYRAYVAEDPDGLRWTIAQARPTMA
jgi:uncharacterized glyoxalase superfamily protein PhnB